MNAEGALQWALRFGSLGDDRGEQIEVDSQGNVIVAGTFEGTVNFGASRVHVSAGESDAFVLWISSDGKVARARTIGGSQAETLDGLAISDRGEVHVAGTFFGSIDLDPGTGETIVTTDDARETWVAKYSESADFRWGGQIGGETGGRVGASRFRGGLAVDAQSRVHIVTQVTATADVDPGESTHSIVPTGVSSLAIVTLDETGVLTRVGQIRQDANILPKSVVYATGITTDEGGNLYLTGIATGPQVDLDPGLGTSYLPAGSEEDAGGFVVSLDDRGQFRWARRIDAVTSGIAVDDAQHVFVAGQGEGDMDPGPATAEIPYSFFVSEFDQTGSFISVASLAESPRKGGDLGVHGIAVNPRREILATGRFAATADFDPAADLHNLYGGPDHGISDTLTNTYGDVWVSKLVQSLRYDAAAENDEGRRLVVQRNGTRLQLKDMDTNEVLVDRTHRLMRSAHIVGLDTKDNVFTIDYETGGYFPLTEGIHYDGGSEGFDLLRVRGVSTARATQMPGPRDGTILISDSETSPIHYTNAELVELSLFEKLTIESQADRDFWSLHGTNGFRSEPATRLSEDAYSIASFFDVQEVVLNTGANDGRGRHDQVTVSENSLVARHLTNLTVDTGRGADLLIVEGKEFDLPEEESLFRFRGGKGFNGLHVTGDSRKYVLSDKEVSSVHGGNILLSRVKEARLTGGDHRNRLNARDFSGDVRLDGGKGHDILRGGSGDDTLIGGGGEDKLFGGGGDDELLAGSGDDLLDGGAGNNRMLGGSGRDLFVVFGTEDDDLISVRAASVSGFQVVRATGTTVDRDYLAINPTDEVFIRTLGGDDSIAINKAITFFGIADGGDGQDAFVGPTDWIRFSCEL